MPEADAKPISNGVPEFAPIGKDYHRMVYDLLSEGMTTGVRDADAAIIAHARTHSGKGTAEPMEVGGVVTRDPRSPESHSSSRSWTAPWSRLERCRVISVMSAGNGDWVTGSSWVITAC